MPSTAGSRDFRRLLRLWTPVVGVHFAGRISKVTARKLAFTYVGFLCFIVSLISFQSFPAFSYGLNAVGWVLFLVSAVVARRQLVAIGASITHYLETLTLSTDSQPPLKNVRRFDEWLEAEGIRRDQVRLAGLVASHSSNDDFAIN